MKKGRKKEILLDFKYQCYVKEKFTDNHKNLKFINLYTWNVLDTKKDPRQRQCVSNGF